MKRILFTTVMTAFLIVGVVAIAGPQSDDEIKQCREKCAETNRDDERTCDTGYQTCRKTCLEANEKRKKKKNCTKSCQTTYGTCLDDVRNSTDKCLTKCGDIE